VPFVGDQVLVGPGLPAANKRAKLKRRVGRPWAPAVGHRERPRPWIVARFYRYRDRATEPRSRTRPCRPREPRTPDDLSGGGRARRPWHPPSLRESASGGFFGIQRVERSLLPAPDEQHVRHPSGPATRTESLSRFSEEEGMAELGMLSASAWRQHCPASPRRYRKPKGRSQCWDPSSRRRRGSALRAVAEKRHRRGRKRRRCRAGPLPRHPCAPASMD